MRRLLLLLITLLPLMASAYDAEIDGIYYNLISKAKIAGVINLRMARCIPPAPESFFPEKVKNSELNCVSLQKIQ